MPQAFETLGDATVRRKRSRGRTAAAAIAVTAIVAGGAFAGLRFLPASPSEPTVGAKVASAPVTSPEQRIDDVWPQAAHEMPTKLPDGGKVRPRAFLDETTVLITAESTFEKADSVLAYNLKNGTTRKLSNIPTPQGTSLFADGFTAGNGHIAWWTARKKDGKEIADLWSVPASGGEPAIVTSFPLPPRSRDGLITALTVLPDGFAWSMGSMGVFKVPFAGGDPQAIAGTQGLHIFQWPWAGSPGPREHRSAPYQTVLNVESGERRAAVTRQNSQPLACGITQCISSLADTTEAGIQGRDGQEGRKVSLPFSAVGPQALRLDRFLTGDGPGWSALYDIKTGTAVDLKVDASGVRYLPGSDPRLLVLPRNDKFLIVNLGSIP
ncbi:hypothetical protein ABGB18_46060 [Nonomuraea sp. B12E4]|uniref:hypothetical protein n=1 Tax=Nonomuraea sp. B12E4 TaxID=3153564 RepID=UPI00325D54E4